MENEETLLDEVVPEVEENNELPPEEDNNKSQEEEGDEVVIQIGDEPQAEAAEEVRAPEWVRELRKSHRELQKRSRELEDQLKATTGAEMKPQPLGNKPTFEECGYDEAKYETAVDAWHSKKAEAEKAERTKAEQAEQANRAWQETLNGYGKAKTDLKVKDFEDAEDIVKDALSVTQQGIILQGSKNAALVVYALGKNPKKAKELASINDPVKFAFAVANLETQLKVTNRKSAPPPEKTVSGNRSISGTVDSQLDRLRTEAEKSGDYSKVAQYKNQLRNKQK